QPAYGQPGYDQGYGAQPGYDQGYGAPQPGGYPDPAAGGYAPPAVQGGPRQLTGILQLDDGSNRTYQLQQGSNVVGRGQDAHFRLPDTGVSRRHLEITWDGQSAMLADLGSTNGTTVNGQPMQTWQLNDGDVIRIGHSTLVYRTQG
ncbi:FHA domain-containing protein, partial [Streptoalloteichus tenebrarius]